MDEKASCPVCKESWGDVFPMVLSCGHSLCVTCMEGGKSSCPVCRKGESDLTIPNIELASAFRCKAPIPKDRKDDALKQQVQTLIKKKEQLVLRAIETMKERFAKALFEEQRHVDVEIPKEYTDRFCTKNSIIDASQLRPMVQKLKDALGVRSLIMYRYIGEHERPRPLSTKQTKPQQPPPSMWGACLPRHPGPEPDSEEEDSSQEEEEEEEAIPEYSLHLVLNLDTCMRRPDELMNPVNRLHV